MASELPELLQPAAGGMPRWNLFRAWTTLVMLTFRRLFWSYNTLMAILPLAACGTFVLRRGYSDMTSDMEAFSRFSEEVLIGLTASFLIPVCALAFATTAIGSEREERTLLFLLMRPIPRWLTVLGMFAAIVPLVVGFAAISFGLYCVAAGDVGQRALRLYLPAVFLMSLAYAALFQLLSICFRHGTIMALVYSLFIEGLLGNMPGIIKRLAINFYGRSMVYEAGAAENLLGPDPDWFVPVSGLTGSLVLLAITAVALAASMWIFQHREYRDLV